MAESWDHLAVELGRRREAVGEMSFGDIAARVTRARREAGADEHAARVARTTVYDCFRTGRTRVNLPLVREIAVVLGATYADVDTWVASCRTPAAPPVVTADSSEHAPEPREERPAVGQVLLLLAACVGLNLLGRMLVDYLHLPIYLDMVGTGVAAIALGPWRGAAVGTTTNVVGAISSGVVSLPFALVNVVGALVWGYGARRGDLGRTLPRFFGLNLLVALACSVVAVPILVLLYGGSVGQGQDDITQTFRELGQGLVLAVGSSNILTSVLDKMVSGFTALVALSALPPVLRRGANLPIVSSPAAGVAVRPGEAGPALG